MMGYNQGGRDARGRGPKLYDLRRDPGERRNVARRHRDVVRRLYGLVRRDAGGRLPRFRL
jgi:hypothetical protein